MRATITTTPTTIREMFTDDERANFRRYSDDEGGESTLSIIPDTSGLHRYNNKIQTTPPLPTDALPVPESGISISENKRETISLVSESTNVVIFDMI